VFSNYQLAQSFAGATVGREKEYGGKVSLFFGKIFLQNSIVLQSMYP
jgi:hypothetical protein